jgi:hypothetical protein
MQAGTIAVIGTHSDANITTWLNSRGFTANDLGSSFPVNYTGVSAVVLLRTAPTGLNSTNLIDFVHNGGTLVTEWDASAWALNTAGLLSAADTGGGFVGTGTPVTFTAGGVAAGLDAGLTNPYSNGGASEFFRTFGSLGTGVSVLGTRGAAVPAILGGASQSGQTIIIGYDWADTFPSTSSASGLLLVNALNANLFAASTPEPSLGIGAGIALAFMGFSRRRKATQA